MQINRQPILDASADYLRTQEAKRQQDEAKSKENGSDDLDEDEDYEYIYVEDDEDDEDDEDNQSTHDTIKDSELTQRTKS